MGNNPLPTSDCVKYLGLHLNRRLTWSKHIKAKKKEATIQLKRLSWLLGRESQLFLDDKLLVYKVINKPIRTYGVELWGSASKSNIDILQRYQNILRTISKAPWFVRNTEIHEHLRMPTVKEEIAKSSKRYKERLTQHTNELARCLMNNEQDTVRLKRWQITNLDRRQ